jgi:hypothetical protein
MSPPLLQRLVLVTTAVLCVASASLFNSPPRGDDGAKSAHEAAVLDRIFANWQARHDRVRSFHFTYDCRTTYRKGKLDLTSEPRTKLDHDQSFDQFGIQLWVDEDRVCLLMTPSFKVPIAKPTDTSRVVARSVTAGDTSYMYYSARWWETGQPQHPPFAPYGLLYPRTVSNAETPNFAFQALALTFRTGHPWPFLKREQCRLVDENAVIDNGHCTQFHRVLKGENPGEETLWVSPVRGDVFVHWTTFAGSKAEGSIKYRKDERYGWIPSEWTCDYPGHMLEECKVTAYGINEKIDPAIFSLDFPPGTPVVDSLALKKPMQNPLAFEAIRYYVVQPGGSKRAISHDEFNRLAHIGNPFKPQRPAKPQAK